VKKESYPILALDTRDPQEAKVIYFDGLKWVFKRISLNRPRRSELLVVINKFLDKQTKVKSLVIVNGQGQRFSSLRLGVVIANSLSFALKVPLYQMILEVNETSDDKLKEKIIARLNKEPLKSLTSVKPIYAHSPNITKGY